MKKKFLLAACSLQLAAFSFAQTEKFDLASFVPPQGWQRLTNNGTLAFTTSKTDNGLTGFCHIILYPSTPSTGKANKDFANAWKNVVAVPLKTSVKPAVQTNNAEGWTVVTGTANVTVQSLTYKTIVTSFTGFGKKIIVQVNTAGDFTTAITDFFNSFSLDSKTTANTTNNTASNPIIMNGKISLKDYYFTVPEGWTSQNRGDHLLLMQSADPAGCSIRILPPQPGSGDLEKDAKAVFNTMYNGWNYTQTGEKQYDLSKGYTLQGLPFFMMEADMNATNASGQYITESGGALILKLQNEIVIIAVRHKPGLLAHIACNNNYNTMRRFFNTLAIKNVSVAKPVMDPNRIVGLWITAENMSVSDYLFAANGNYQRGGAIGSSTTTSDDRYVYIQNKAYSFEGDGSYKLTDGVLQLKPRGGSSESKSIRFDQVNHGGTGWKDRLWMRSSGVGGENEVRYEKK